MTAIVLASAFIPAAPAAIALDASSATSATNAASVSWSHTTASGATLLVVGLATADTSASVLAVSSITYNGTALTAVPGSDATSGSSTLDQTRLFYLLNPPSATVTFSVVSVSATTPTYQWRKNGSAISGATGSSLTLSNVHSADAGAYSVAITNAVKSGTATTVSDDALLQLQ